MGTGYKKSSISSINKKSLLGTVFKWLFLFQRLEYVENESISPVIEHRSGESSEKHVKNVIEHIEHLLKEGTTADCIIDYSNVSKAHIFLI